MAHATASGTWHQPASLTHRLSSALHGVWNAYWAHKAERTTVLILSSLDDRTLKDIGMDRTEIESVVRNQGGERRVGIGAANELRRRSAMCA
jgi:uncharacterized protein YjiS (DUF1127 family)